MILTQCVGLGLLLSLYLAEGLGYMAGGLVVPGYFAVISSNPMALAATLGSSFLAMFCLRFFSKFALIYGRRRLLVSVLMGFVFSELSRQLFFLFPDETLLSMQAIGFIIPGLLAYWMDKQGILPAIGMLGVVVTLVRLIIIVVHGGAPVL